MKVFIIKILLVLILGLLIGSFFGNMSKNSRVSLIHIFFKPSKEYIDVNSSLYGYDDLARLAAYYTFIDNPNPDVDLFISLFKKERNKVHRDTFIWIINSTLPEKKVVKIYRKLYKSLSKYEMVMYQNNFKNYFNKSLKSYSPVEEN